MSGAVTNHAVACLDSKTRLRVLCGSCGRQLATVYEWSDDDPDAGDDNRFGRDLILHIAWGEGRDGIYRLPRRVIRRWKESGGTSHISVRRNKQTSRELSALTVNFTEFSSEEGKAYLAARRRRGYDTAFVLPLRVECYHCGSMQLLDAVRLDVSDVGRFGWSDLRTS